MGRRSWVLVFGAVLLMLVGCTSLLEREYVTATPHSDTPQAAGESDALRVESYQELMNALLYLVNLGEESGTLRLYGYDSETAKADLTSACLEVSEEVPLGAYRVSYLQFDLATIVSYQEADITILYRPETLSVEDIQAAIGPSAIRDVFARGLEQFQREMVFYVNYFDGDEAELEELLWRAYYEVPGSALGRPEVMIQFYPHTGTQRIAEVKLAYRSNQAVQLYYQNMLAECVTQLVEERVAAGGGDLLDLCCLVLEQGGLSESGSTAYNALVGGGATSEGLSLALALLCEEQGIHCSVVQGTVNGVDHFWNVVMTPWGYRHVDLSTFELELWQETEAEEVSGPFFSDRTALEAGYSWNRNLLPLCGAQPEAEGN